MYVCATGSIPIAAALMLKGMSPGCALVLLMAGPAANMASMFVVNNTFGRKATIIYLLSIIGGAIGFGVLVDYLPGLRETFINALPCHMMHHGMHGASWLNTVCSVALIGMIIVALGAKYWKSYQIKRNKTATMKEFKVKGMMCAHCKANVEKGLAAPKVPLWSRVPSPTSSSSTASRTWATSTSLDYLENLELLDYLDLERKNNRNSYFTAV